MNIGPDHDSHQHVKGHIINLWYRQEFLLHFNTSTTGPHCRLIIKSVFVRSTTSRYNFHLGLSTSRCTCSSPAITMDLRMAKMRSSGENGCFGVRALWRYSLLKSPPSQTLPYPDPQISRYFLARSYFHCISTVDGIRWPDLYDYWCELYSDRSFEELLKSKPNGFIFLDYTAWTFY